jgi:hypothetical protein
VFPDEFGRNPDKAVEATMTAGGIAEAIEDGYESRDLKRRQGTVTPLRGRRSRKPDQLGDSSEPRVSKTS